MPAIPTLRNNIVSAEDIGAYFIKLFSSAFPPLVTIQKYGRNKNNCRR